MVPRNIGLEKIPGLFSSCVICRYHAKDPPQTNTGDPVLNFPVTIKM